MNRKKRRDIKFGRHNAGIKIAREGVGAESLGHEEEGHVVVVTTVGLAMLVAGLRSIALESPEVEPLLETLEGALREGVEARKEAGVLVRESEAPVELVSSERSGSGESEGGLSGVHSSRGGEGEFADPDPSV